MPRKSHASSQQLDFFGSPPVAPETPSRGTDRKDAQKPATAQFDEQPFSKDPVSTIRDDAPTSREIIVSQAGRHADHSKPIERQANLDVWWTTAMVCEFLKISRKTLWLRRRDRRLEFPCPVHLAGKRNLYRASAIRAWADMTAVA
jgi:predicted DNA-binding transcriptional regulator AlpA